MTPFQKIKTIIKKKFNKTTKIKSIITKNHPQLIPTNPQFKPHTKYNLIYLITSPNFYKPNPKTNSFKTKNHIYNKTSKTINNYKLIYYNKKYKTQKQKIINKYFYKFH